MPPCSNSCSDEEQQPAGLSTAECPGPKSSAMKREVGGGGAYPSGHGKADSNNSSSIEEGISNINAQMERTSLHQLSHSLSCSSKSLTNSAPTILVHTPDDNSYHRVHRPIRSAMVSRTLHESLHRGKQAGREEKKVRSQSAVSFDQVNIREYERILGDNPSCTSGPPLSIGWKFSPDPMVISVDDYEDGKGDTPRYKSQFLVPKQIREQMLKEHAGVSRRDIVATVRGIQKQKSQRRKTAANLNMQGTEEKVETVRRSLQKVIGKRKSFSKEEKKLWDGAHERAVEKAKDLENSIRKGESISMRNVYSVGTPANCILPSRRASGEYYHLSAEEKHAVTDPRRVSEGEAKEEEVAPTSIDHEVVSEGAGRDTVPSQEPGSESLRRSIVICEEIDDDDIFDQIVASTH
mmetsp:Transcript_29250/g.49858  ORF Transcript_29250/g.49858 Transcript_29250/m.49858 type:complete len:407 (+) Transcript_29250:85-1305(+)